jgi:NAD(P)H-hydrate epimerase
LYTGDGPDHTGDIVFDDLGVPARIYQRVAPTASRLELEELRRLLPQRRRSAHKGHFGHVLVIGGDVGYGGAARMAGEAALRVGAGLVSLATRAAHAPEITAARPELMCHPVEQPGELQALLERSSVLAVGPGLGRSPWARSLLARVLDSSLPRVLDADALNGLADEPQRGANWVLTPHPGEAARLLGCPTPEVQADRYGAVVEIQRRYGGVAVLKGAGTLMCDGSGPTAVCAQGNPGMASGGMGDVLTGIIGGLLAQGLAPYEAACLGVCVHAAAGDRAAQGGERGLIATDLLPVLRSLVNSST